MKTHHTRTT